MAENLATVLEGRPAHEHEKVKIFEVSSHGKILAA
jgi:hypothetical protein